MGSSSKRRKRGDGVGGGSLVLFKNPKLIMIDDFQCFPVLMQIYFCDRVSPIPLFIQYLFEKVKFC